MDAIDYYTTEIEKLTKEVSFSDYYTTETKVGMEACVR